MTFADNEPQRAIVQYHEGLMTNAPAEVLAALAPHFMMVNGNYSGDPTDWQAHLFLTGPALAEWPALFLREAGPYHNHYEVLHIDIRGDAAVVVTKDTGQNRFRTWEDEIVAWSLGRYEGEWKIVSLFIRDLRNPE